MMSLRKALMAATILSLPLAAQAQPITGLYVGGGAGANWVQSSTNNVDSDSSVRVRLGLPNDSLKAKYELGWGGVASIQPGMVHGEAAGPLQARHPQHVEKGDEVRLSRQPGGQQVAQPVARPGWQGRGQFHRLPREIQGPRLGGGAAWTAQAGLGLAAEDAGQGEFEGMALLQGAAAEGTPAGGLADVGKALKPRFLAGEIQERVLDGVM